MEQNQQLKSQEQDQQQSTQQNRSEIRIFPYVQLDGHYPSDNGWPISERGLGSIFQKMVEQGLLKTTFWEGNITEESHFVNLCRSPNNHMVFFLEEATVVGFAWLSSVTSNYAFAHFCLFKEIWGKSVEVGKNCVDYWFSWPTDQGERLLDIIVGIMPGFNTRAHKYVEKLGWTRLGQIPGMFRDKDRNREYAVIYYVGR